MSFSTLRHGKGGRSAKPATGVEHFERTSDEAKQLAELVYDGTVKTDATPGTIKSDHDKLFGRFETRSFRIGLTFVRSVVACEKPTPPSWGICSWMNDGGATPSRKLSLVARVVCLSSSFLKSFISFFLFLLQSTAAFSGSPTRLIKPPPQ